MILTIVRGAKKFPGIYKPGRKHPKTKLKMGAEFRTIKYYPELKPITKSEWHLLRQEYKNYKND